MHHFHERDTIQTTGKFVKLICSLSSIKGTQLLQLSDPDCKNVAEYRFVYLPKQTRKAMLSFRVPFLIGDREQVT